MIDILKDILIALGGGTTVAVLIIRFLSDKIAERVAQNHELNLQKQLEAFKE